MARRGLTELRGPCRPVRPAPVRRNRAGNRTALPPSAGRPPRAPFGLRLPAARFRPSSRLPAESGHVQGPRPFQASAGRRHGQHPVVRRALCGHRIGPHTRLFPVLTEPEGCQRTSLWPCSAASGCAIRIRGRIQPQLTEPCGQGGWLKQASRPPARRFSSADMRAAGRPGSAWRPVPPCP
jgi:hypothetical protein